MLGKIALRGDGFRQRDMVRVQCVRRHSVQGSSKLKLLTKHCRRNVSLFIYGTDFEGVGAAG